MKKQYEDYASDFINKNYIYKGNFIIPIKIKSVEEVYNNFDPTRKILSSELEEYLPSFAVSQF